MSVRFRVYGTPAPQGSKVRTRWGMREASTKLMPWREAIVSQIIRDGWDTALLDGPLVVRVQFIFDRPAAHYGTRKGVKYLKDTAPYYKTTTPDLDKLCRSLGDALTQGGAIKDDDLIVCWHAEKIYGERAGAVVEVLPATL